MAGTPDRLQAVGRVRLWDFLLVLSYQKAEAKFKEAIYDLQKK